MSNSFSYFRIPFIAVTQDNGARDKPERKYSSKMEQAHRSWSQTGLRQLEGRTNENLINS